MNPGREDEDQMNEEPEEDGERMYDESEEDDDQMYGESEEYEDRSYRAPEAYEEGVYEESPLGIMLIVGLPFLMVVLIMYAYLFIFTDMDTSPKLWWAGFATFVVAIIFYVFHALMGGQKMIRNLSALLFGLGAAMFYMAVWFHPVSPADEGKKAFGLMAILAIFVIILILGIYELYRTREQAPVRVRMAKRR
jgi:hypothetical protein